MKTAVIYWSGTGNTEALANAAAEGAGVVAQTVSDFSDDVSGYDALVLGCPAMGAEVLEEDEFELWLLRLGRWRVDEKLAGACDRSRCGACRGRGFYRQRSSVR